MALLAFICISASMLSCVGGSTEQGNARISGAVINGPTMSTKVSVHLVAETYDPFESGSGTVYTSETDSQGNFDFLRVQFGSYYLYAFDSTLSFTFLKGPYRISSAWNSGRDSLQKASTITLADVDSVRDSLASYYIKGTSVAKMFRDNLSRSVKIFGVPAGIHDVMRYSPNLASNNKSSFYSEKVEILPDDSIAINFQNRPPRIAAVQLPIDVFTDTTYTIKISGIDPDADSVFVHLVTTLESYALDSVSGVFTWTPRQADVHILSISFRLSDRHGAYSVYKWNVRVRQRGTAPALDVPAGPSACFAESMAVYSVTKPIVACRFSPPRYRFSWGNGDTSDWSQSGSLSHHWPLPGTYAVSVQGQCDDYLLASPWSTPLKVIVNKSRTTASPVMKNASKAMVAYDTFAVSIAPITCAAVAFYRFYVNDTAVTDWQKDTVFYFSSDNGGIFSIRAAAWCDTAIAKPSDLSQPCSATVKFVYLSEPKLLGDTVYSVAENGLAPVSISIVGDSVVDGRPILHRYRINNKYISTDSTKLLAAYIVLKDTCKTSPNCKDTFPVNLNDTTQWFTGTSFELLLYKPTGYYILNAQASIKGHMESNWSYFDIYPLQ
jgi:hypothetical protein